MKIYLRIYGYSLQQAMLGSLGAALAYWHHELKKPRNKFEDKMKGSCGPKFENNFIEQKLNHLKRATKNPVGKK